MVRLGLLNQKLYRNVMNETGINILALGGARGVMVIAIGNGHGDTSSNSGRD